MAWIIMVSMLTFGNFVYQLFTERDFGVATERSWFQLWAVITAYIVQPWE